MVNDQVPQATLFTRIEKSNNIVWSEIKTNPNYKCKACSICFVDEELLERHIRIMHEKTEKSVVGGSKPSEIKSFVVQSADDGQIIDNIQPNEYTIIPTKYQENLGNNQKIQVQHKQPFSYTKCVFCEFLPNLGSDSANKPQMRDHYITKHYKEKCLKFLRQNKNSNAPYLCHVKECHYSTKSVRNTHELLRHYARNHGILERFYEDKDPNNLGKALNKLSHFMIKHYH